MDKMGYPRGLVRYSTEHAIEAHWGWREILGHVVRPRILVYSAILWLIIGAFIWGLATKPSLRVDVMRDRSTLAREVEGGLVENLYRLQIMNVSEKPQRFTLSAQGMDGLSMIGEPSIELAAGSARTVTVQVRVPPESGKKGSNLIYFDVVSANDAKVSVHEKATFIQP